MRQHFKELLLVMLIGGLIWSLAFNTVFLPTGNIAPIANIPLKTNDDEGASSILETHFNVTGYSSNNITIASNETVQLGHVPGYYLGLYSFRNDATGADPAGWTITEGATYTVQVIAAHDGHNKDVEFYDNEATNNPMISNTFTAQVIGTIESWVKTVVGGSQNQVAITIYSGATIGAQIGIDFGSGATKVIKVYYSSAWHTIDTWTDSVWTHLRVAFNCTADTFQMWINGVDKGSWAFRNDIASATKLQVGGSSSNPATFYLDAVDYSWDTGYFTNRSTNLEYNKTGLYTSPIYDLTSAAFYQTIIFNRTLGTSGTALTLQYRDSRNNVNWNSWSAGFTTNLTIDAFKNRYFQFRINLSSTWSSANHYQYTAWCYWINFTYTPSGEAQIICELEYLLGLLQNNISTLQQENMQLQQNINRLQANITVLFAAIAQFQSNLTVLQQINLDLQYQLLLLQGNLTTLIQINLAFQMTILQLEANITQLLTINLQLQGNLTVLQQINLDLQLTNLQLAASIVYFQSTNILLQGNITQLQLTIVQLQQVIANLQLQGSGINVDLIKMVIGWALLLCGLAFAVFGIIVYIKRPKPVKEKSIPVYEEPIEI